MPANTPLGYPYPLGTDRVMDGDDAIHNLATAVDTRAGVFASGLAQIASVGGTTVGVAITLPVGRFTLPPNIATSINFGAFGTLSVLFVGATAVTAASFTLNLARTGGGSGTVGVFWIANQAT